MDREILKRSIRKLHYVEMFGVAEVSLCPWISRDESIFSSKSDNKEYDVHGKCVWNTSDKRNAVRRVLCDAITIMLVMKQSLDRKRQKFTPKEIACYSHSSAK